jgi:hypothetical protein
MTPTPNNLLEYALKTRCWNLMLVSSFLKTWSSQPDNVEKLARFPVVVSITFERKTSILILLSPTEVVHCPSW